MDERGDNNIMIDGCLAGGIARSRGRCLPESVYAIETLARCYARQDAPTNQPTIPVVLPVRTSLWTPLARAFDEPRFTGRRRALPPRSLYKNSAMERFQDRVAEVSRLLVHADAGPGDLTRTSTILRSFARPKRATARGI